LPLQNTRHETTSSALTWVAYLLAIHPNFQSRLRAEIHAAIPSPSTLLDAADTYIAGLLESLSCLNAICNETLRLYPTVPSTARIAIRDTTVAGTPIRKGTLLLLEPWVINRSPELWGPDAATFNPDRWIDPDTGRANYMGSADTNYSFLTFLHGPRSCIGEKFARAELRALVATVCGSFEMSMADPNEKVIPAGTITVKPKNGMRLTWKSTGWQ
jgi:cytochrome P450